MERYEEDILEIGWPTHSETDAVEDDLTSLYLWQAEDVCARLRRAHHKFNSGTYHAQRIVERASEFLDAAPEPVWLFAFEAGLMDEILHMIFDVEFFGSTAAAIRFWERKPLSHLFSARYVALVIHILGMASTQLYRFIIAKQSDDPFEEYRPMVVAAAQAALEHISEFWRLVYDLRTSLLGTTFMQLTFLHNERGMDKQLPRIVSNFQHIRRTLGGIPAHHQLDAELCLLSVWLNSKSLWIGYDALKTANFSVGEKSEHVVFCQRALSEVAPLGILNKRFRQDYKQEDLLNKDLKRFMDAHSHFTVGLVANEVDVLDPLTIWYVLAACRRQLCHGTRAENTSAVLISSLLFLGESFRRVLLMTLDAELLLPEELLHATVAHLVTTFPHVIFLKTQHADDYLADFENIMQGCKAAFLTLRRARRPRTVSRLLDAARGHTALCCEELLESARQYSHKIRPRWRGLIPAWERLVRALPEASSRVEPGMRTPAAGVLERCAWQKCHCSVFKPAHPMRICNGCDSLAYCSRKCQISDWTEGEHKMRCGKSNRYQSAGGSGSS